MPAVQSIGMTGKALRLEPAIAAFMEQSIFTQLVLTEDAQRLSQIRQWDVHDQHVSDCVQW